MFGAGAPTLTGSDPDNFEILGETCAGQRLDTGDTCTVDVRFRPSGRGAWEAEVEYQAGTAAGVVRLALAAEGRQCTVGMRPPQSFPPDVCL